MNNYIFPGFSFWLLFFIIIGTVVYFIPTIVARFRDSNRSSQVFVLNFFLGWTFVFWVIALAIAVGEDKIVNKSAGESGRVLDDIGNKTEKDKKELSSKKVVKREAVQQEINKSTQKNKKED